MENLVRFSDYAPGDTRCSNQPKRASDSSSRNHQALKFNNEFKNNNKGKIKGKKCPVNQSTDLHTDAQSSSDIDLNVFPLKRHLQIVIMGNSSDGSLSKMDMLEIERLLICQINNIAYQQHGPELKFHSLTWLNNGWILLNCHNESTFQWVFDWFATKFRHFKVVKASAAPWKPIKVCLTISEMAININDVVKILISQNWSLQLDTWKLVETYKENGFWYLYFLVPSDGVQYLQGSCWKVGFVLERLTVSVVEDQYME